MSIFTQPSPGQAESRLSENLHSKSPPFLTKWFDPLDLSYRKSFWIWFIYTPEGYVLVLQFFFVYKVSFLKHPSVYSTIYVNVDSPNLGFPYLNFYGGEGLNIRFHMNFGNAKL